MSILGAEQVQMVKRFIFENGRLLERQLFEYFFGNGAREACTLIIFPSLVVLGIMLTTVSRMKLLCLRHVSSLRLYKKMVDWMRHIRNFHTGGRFLLWMD